MKIVYLAESDLPNRAAHGVHIMRMCEALSDLGHEVVLVLTNERDGRTPPTDDLFRYYGVRRGFRIERIRRSMVKGGIYVYALKAARLAGRERPDLVYGRFLAGCFFVALFARRAAPVVYEAHAAIKQAGWFSEILFKIASAGDLFRYVVVVTESLKSHMVQHYRVRSARVIVAPDAASPSGGGKIETARTHALNIGYTGHLYEGRGMELMLALAGRCPWAFFHIIGGEQGAVADWRSRAGGIHNIVFHGYVEPRDVHKYQNAMDVLLAPYQTRVRVSGNVGDTVSWMSPLKIFEYMSAGKAIVCSDLPVLREVLTDGRNALLCTPDSVPDWERALTRLRDEPRLRERLAQTAHGDFNARYTWKRRAARVLDQVARPEAVTV